MAYRWVWWAAVAGMGVVAGMRSLTAPAVMSRQLASEPQHAPQDPIDAVMSSPTTAKVLTALAIGEQIIDKLPGVPPRVQATSLAPRIVAGLASAAPIALRHSLRVMPVAAVATIGAVAGAYAFYHLRKRLVARGAPDPLVGVAEDTLAMAIASWFSRRV